MRNQKWRVCSWQGQLVFFSPEKFWKSCPTTTNTTKLDIDCITSPLPPLSFILSDRRGSTEYIGQKKKSVKRFNFLNQLEVEIVDIVHANWVVVQLIRVKTELSKCVSRTVHMKCVQSWCYAKGVHWIWSNSLTLYIHWNLLAALTE